MDAYHFSRQLVRKLSWKFFSCRIQQIDTYMLQVRQFDEKLVLEFSDLYQNFSNGQISFDQVFEKVEAYIETGLAPHNNPHFEHIYPIVRPASLAASLLQGDENNRMLGEALNNDLDLLLVDDSEGVAQQISSEHLSKWDVSYEELRRLALANLNDHLSSIELEPRNFADDQPLNAYSFALDGHFDASVLLQQDFTEEWQDQFKGVPVMFVPGDDLMMLVDSADMRAYQAVLVFAEAYYAKANVPISPFGYIWSEGKLKRFQAYEVHAKGVLN